MELTEQNMTPDGSLRWTGTKFKESRTKTILEESTVVSREMVVKVENTVKLLPFVPAITEVNISEHFVPPQFKMYDKSITRRIISIRSPTRWRFTLGTTTSVVEPSLCLWKEKR